MSWSKPCIRATWLAVAAGLVIGATGCASSTKVGEFPKTVEATLEAKQTEPDKIGYLDVKPWAVNPGDKVDVTMGGSADRKASVAISPAEGGAPVKTLSLAPREAGVYAGSLDTTGLAPGRYRVEGTLAGGPSGEPVKLVSSRAFTVNQPAPPEPKVDACDQAKAVLATPQIHFAYDKSDLDTAARAYLKDVAAKLTALGNRVGHVTIEGHCDERGTVNYNLALGGRRANAVKSALMKEPGMKGLKIDTISKGKEEPLVPNASSEEDHAKNRRAIFNLECTPAQ